MATMRSLANPLYEHFAAGSLDHHWTRLAIGRSRVDLGGGLRLAIDEAREGQLALAQLDDHIARPRAGYLWQPPLVMEARARFCPGDGFLGTAGFGFWNNPAPLWATRFEASPHWLWFYYASEQSTLSYLPGPPHGFKAAAVSGGRGGTLAMTLFAPLLKAPLAGPRLGRTRLPADEMTLDRGLMGAWHTYRIAWLADRVAFQVDGTRVLETAHVAAGPLAFVAWADNAYAAPDARGEMQLGHLAVSQPQWLELEYLSIARPG